MKDKMTGQKQKGKQAQNKKSKFDKKKKTEDKPKKGKRKSDEQQEGSGVKRKREDDKEGEKRDKDGDSGGGVKRSHDEEDSERMSKFQICLGTVTFFSVVDAVTSIEVISFLTLTNHYLSINL